MNINIKNFPEKNIENIKIYGETSYENAIASLSSRLHAIKAKKVYSCEEKNEMLGLIEEFLQYKRTKQGYNEDIDVTKVAENPFQCPLFSEFFNVPFLPVENPTFTFIDLFAGIGGFRLAMQNLGGRCVFSSEWDAQAQKTYLQNYGEMPFGDITKESTKSFIPDNFDVLCAGFPCQAFSKAGKQAGVNDTRGTLFFEVESILRDKQPKYIFLENVRNLVSHDHGNTWRIITENLKALGYRLTKEPLILSPHQFGVPQFRERVYILGVLDPENADSPIEFELPTLLKKDDNSIDSILVANDTISELSIDKQEKMVLGAWNEFYQGIKEKTIGFPVWANYFLSKEDISLYPKWKQDFILKNRHLYENNKTFIDKWLKRYNYLESFTPTQRKFEWQAGESISSIWEGVIQFRPSGIRVKKPNFFPALVAIVQIPIVGKYKRRLSKRECARLQSFPDKFLPASNDQIAYKQLGNSVNITIIQFLMNQLITKY